LAVLPGVTGACSWEDGCGIRANKKGGKMKRGNKKEFEKDPDQYFKPLSADVIKTYADDYTQIVGLVRDAINAMDVDNQRYYYLSRAYSEYAIYRVNYIGVNTPSKYMKQDYSIQEGNLVWTSEAIEVNKNVTFTPKTQTFEGKTKTHKKENDMSKTMKECCPEKVEELIKNNSSFTEEDSDTLLGMTEDAFALTINAAKPIKEPKKKKEEPKTNADEPKTNADEPKMEEPAKQMTYEELLANADPETRESIEAGKKILAQKKKGLIDTLKTNKTLFSDEELDGFSMDMLEKIVGGLPKAAPKVNDYSMSNPGGAIIDNDDDAPEPLPSPHTNWEKSDK